MSKGKETMPYEIWGEDAATSQERLEKYTGVVDWSYLKAACLNEVLYYLDQSLSLKTASEAFIADDAAQMKAWLKSGELVKMGTLHLQYFESHREQLFEVVVVSPFVLCRECEK